MLKNLTKDDMPSSVIDIVDTIGIDAFKDLVKLVGGGSVYIPNESNLIKSYRNKMIKKEFSGDYKSISRKYGISEMQVRNIINSKDIRQ